jgi:pilus assembly protein CpaC
MVRIAKWDVSGVRVTWRRTMTSAAKALIVSAALAAMTLPSPEPAAAQQPAPREPRGQQQPAGPRRVREIPGITGPASPSTSASGVAEPQRVLPLYPGEARLIDAPWPVARVSVANPEIADVDVINPQQVQLIGVAPGVTNLVLWSKDERTWRARVEVEADLSKLEGQLKKMFPRSDLSVSQVGDVIAVKGTLPLAENAVQLRQFLTTAKINHVDLTHVAGSQQVQLKVRIAEASRSALRSLSADYAFGDLTRNFAVNNGASGTFTPSTPIGNLERSLPISTTVFGAGTINGNFFEYFIQALADNQYLRLLSEPTLVAYNGEEARFLVGGEVPIPISDLGEGTTSISIEYREYGVRLRFKPTVVGEGGIRLNVEPEVSQLSDVGAIEILGSRIPGLITRRVSTTLELKDGQTFAIAGLLDNSVNAQNSRIPGLGDIPILGTMFRSVRYENKETELLVIVTASLAEPQSVPMENVPYPGMRHVAPNDWEIYLNGSLEGKVASQLPPVQVERMKQLGIDKLKGPGAWASYEPRPRKASDGKEPLPPAPQ